MTTHSLTEIAGLLRVSKVSVSNWLNAGCPFVERPGSKPGAEWKLSLPDVVQWLRERDVKTALARNQNVDFDEARRRKTAAEAALAELELAKQRGDVVSIAVVADVVAEQMSACKARLLSIPTKCAPLVAPVMDVQETEAILEGAMREACDELVGYAAGELGAGAMEAEVDAPEADAGAVSAAPAADRKRVGRPVSKTQRRGKRGAGAVDHRPQ